VLDAVAELGQDLVGEVLGGWVMKNTPTPLERISRTVRCTWSTNALEAPSNSR
jgi:hypothetical protein